MAAKKDEHEELYEAAKEAVNKLFGDTSVSKSRTRESLQSLKDEIDVMLDSM